MHTAVPAQSQPTDVDGWTAHGIAAAQRGQLTQAIACFEQAAMLQPHNPVLLCNLGVALTQAGRFDQALHVLQRATAAAPGQTTAWFLMGNVCMAQRDWPAARDHYTQALHLQPQAVDTLRNRAVAQLQCHSLDAARSDCLAALGLDPQHEATWRNLGLIERERGALADSVQAYDRALSLCPKSAHAHTDRAHALLLAGQFAQGWEGYAHRWHKPLFALPPAIQALPTWDGNDLNGRTLLLHCEQGLGDTLQFCRYVPEVKALGGRVVLAVQPSLVKLLSNNFAGMATVCAINEPLPACDVRCALLDLPRVLGATSEPFAHASGYLRVDAEHLQARPVDDTRPRVGLVWRGSARHPNDHRRSLDRDQLLAHLPQGLPYIDLQVDADDSDWCDTAARVAALDLVITVDTSMAHLAGAMGKPAWVLLSYAPDWRWQLNRSDSPWYRSLRLFRQAAPGDWSAPLQAMGAAIANWPPQPEGTHAGQH